MTKTFMPRWLWPLQLILVAGLPWLGVYGAGEDMKRYTEFPPVARHVAHAPFSWIAFLALAVLILSVVLFFGRRMLRGSPAVARLEARGRWPVWGYAGLVWMVLAWAVAWTRFDFMSRGQAFTFTPLWLGYIVVVQAWTHQRTGSCMMRRAPVRFAGLFAMSAAFWWYFECLNRFVQNWLYEGVDTMGTGVYFAFATLSFSTVLPAVLGTAELLASFPRLTAGLGGFAPLRLRAPRAAAAVTLVAASAALLAMGRWPNVLFPLVWIAPLAVGFSLQALAGRPTLLDPVGRGDWRRLARLALASLICGFFWETWNEYSLARWVYEVPFVDRFHLFEMPLLGFAGYVPFGWECAWVGDAVLPPDPEKEMP